MAPGIDGILYCKAPVPEEYINDMLAMMYEKQLKPVSPQALYDAVPVCKPAITSLIVEKKETEISALFAAAGALLVVLAAGLSVWWFGRVA